MKKPKLQDNGGYEPFSVITESGGYMTTSEIITAYEKMMDALIECYVFINGVAYHGIDPKGKLFEQNMENIERTLESAGVE